MNSRPVTLQEWSQQMRSVLRIVAGLLFVQHGSAKLLHARIRRCSLICN
jgi:uncharacterized membrane protein YphA (DoxX/SURF4 family)